MAFPFAQLGAGLLSGLFSSGPSISPEQKRLLKLQTQTARGLQQYSQGVPGSDPQELQALASQRGLLGQQQRATLSGLFANLGPQGPVDQGTLLRDLMTQFQGQQSAAASNLFNQFFQNRGNALLQSAAVASGAVPAAQPNVPGFDIGGVLMDFFKQQEYLKALRRSRQGTAGLQSTPGIVYGPQGSVPSTNDQLLQTLKKLLEERTGGGGPLLRF